MLYFNPHGEKVDKFTRDPMGAYPVVLSAADLERELGNWQSWQHAVVDHADAFLNLHTGSASLDIYAASVEALQQANGPKGDAETMARFKHIMCGIDRRSSALTRPGGRETALFPELEYLDEGIAAFTRTALMTPGDRVKRRIEKPRKVSAHATARKLDQLLSELKDIVNS